MMNHQSFVLKIYISFDKGVEYSIGPLQLLADASSGPHGMIFWLQLSHNVIFILQFIIHDLDQLSCLECDEYVGSHTTSLITNF